MPLRNLAWMLIVPAFVALGLTICYSAPVPDRDYQRVRQLVDVMAEVDTHFYRPLSEDEKQQLVEDMINGGLQKLDRNSEYLNPTQLKQFKSDSEGSYAGVGIMLAVDQDTTALKVDHPLAGTPAYEAGIIAGDLIMKIDDDSTAGMSVVEARKRIRGTPDTRVRLMIRRPGRNPPDQEVTLTRTLVAQHPISGVRRRAEDPNEWEWFIDRPAGIGYIRLAAFNELSARELKAAIAEIERAGGKGLILDLRENPGGLLTQSIEVSNLFLSEGKPIVSTRGRNGDRERVFKAEKNQEVFTPAADRPIVVLVNENSASASEIVASALQDNGRAVIVGERSYGKGSVQKLLYLQWGEEEAALKLTTETYWRPSGKNMDKKLAPKERPDEWGVKPDVEVVLTDDEKERAAWDYYRALWLAGKPSAVGPNPPQPPDLKQPGSLFQGLRSAVTPGVPAPPVQLPEDRQLKTAIEILKKKLGAQ